MGKSGAYYSERDPYAAAWLRNLITGGHIAPGEVDERDIRDVRADDVRGYTQCHFFAGIGGWSLALRLAGWPDDRPVWTGSCPCQPFSSAGAGKGAGDGRHLWPTWASLIRQCRPGTIFGEQVAAAIKHGWLDAVFADLEAEGYACGAAVLPACGVGAPHIRQRLWFVADAEGGRGNGAIQPRERQGFPEPVWASSTRGVADAEGEFERLSVRSEGRQNPEPERSGAARGVADSTGSGRREEYPHDGRGTPGDSAQGLAAGPMPSGDARGLADASHERHERAGGPWQRRDGPAHDGAAHGMGDTDHPRLQERERDERVQRQALGASERQAAERGSDARGFWSDALWLPCTDGKARPIEPGIEPLVDRLSFRVGSGSPFTGKSRAQMLKAYGNAIVPQVGAEFVRAFME